MAGSYPDAPKRRMAWDVDLTVNLYQIAPGAGNPDNTAVGGNPQGPFTAMSAGHADAANDEEASVIAFSKSPIGGAREFMYVVNIFPQVREVDGYFLDYETDTTGWIAYSLDTSNGRDGSWTAIDGSWLQVGPKPFDDYRDSISSTAISGVKSIKLQTDENNIAQCYRHHLYGTILTATTPDRIIIQDPDNGFAEFAKPLDWGDQPRGQTALDTVRLLNNSSTQTANTVQITAESLYLNSGAWYTFSDDDVTYSATLNIGNLSTSATQLIYVKQVIPGGESAQLHAARMKVNVGSWT